uniref:Uncharacterized protein n=1 Tax=Physcomitrium patens TaxID=3218 RepID=A0A2K1J1N4_PHYPA|nr:hypothetical protein PHYPA_023327 [Physcomitrium patens]
MAMKMITPTIHVLGRSADLRVPFTDEK